MRPAVCPQPLQIPVESHTHCGYRQDRTPVCGSQQGFARNSSTGELLVRLTPTRVTAVADVSD